MRGLNLSGRAGGARRHRDSLQVEGDHGGLGFHALKGEQGRIRQPRRSRAEDHGVWGDLQSPDSSLSRSACICAGLGGVLAIGRQSRGAEADDADDVLGAGAQAALLAATADERLRK